MLYDLIAHCIPPTVILKTLTFNLLSKVSNEIGPDLIEKSAFYDHRLRQGSKAIFHLEAMIANYMQILEKYVFIFILLLLSSTNHPGLTQTKILFI